MANHPPEEDKFQFDTRWFKDIPAEEVDSFKRDIISSKKVLDRLTQIVYNIVTSEEDVRLSDYDNPNWSHKMAHTLGRKDAFSTILRLVKLEK
jgi:hypothetical protein